jgi:hypothetical protein
MCRTYTSVIYNQKNKNMKKIIGWILIVLAGFNLISIFFSLIGVTPVGSPGYIIVVIMMFFGGLSLINSKKDNTEGGTDLQKNEDD